MAFHNAHFLIPEILWQQLQKRAWDTNQSMTKILSDALQRYLKTSTSTTTPKTATRAGRRASKKNTSKNG